MNVQNADPLCDALDASPADPAMDGGAPESERTDGGGKRQPDGSQLLGSGDPVRVERLATKPSAPERAIAMPSLVRSATGRCGAAANSTLLGTPQVRIIPKAPAVPLATLSP